MSLHSASRTETRRFPTTLSLAGNMRTRSDDIVGIEVASSLNDVDEALSGQKFFVFRVSVWLSVRVDS